MHMILCNNCNNTWCSMQVQHYSMFTKLCSSTSCVPRVCKGEGGTVEFTMTCSVVNVPSVSLPSSLPVFLFRYLVMTLNSLFRGKCLETWRMECLLLVSITSQSELKQFVLTSAFTPVINLLLFHLSHVAMSWFLPSIQFFFLLASLTQLNV